MKTYSQASEDVERIIQRVRDQWHSPDLDGVTIGALFVYDMEATEPVLKHGGYPAQATMEITPVKRRALGVADAVITIDRSNWLTLTPAQRDALIDHELYHLERVLEKDTEVPKCDAIDRPKLKIRRHDHQIGFFSHIIERHKTASAEYRMVKALFDDCGQAYWEFESKGPPPSGKARGVEVESQEFYNEACFLVGCGQGSTVTPKHLQNGFKIGYNRACYLLERMERDGFVGPIDADGTRKVLTDCTPKKPVGESAGATH